MIDFKGSQCDGGIILCEVRWCAAYLINYRPLEEMRKIAVIRCSYTELNQRHTQVLFTSRI